MKNYIRKPNNPLHTPNNRPKLSRQPPIAEILQAYQNSPSVSSSRATIQKALDNRHAPLQLTKVVVNGTVVKGSEEENFFSTCMEIMSNCGFKRDNHAMSLRKYQKYYDAFTDITLKTEYDLKVIQHLKENIERCTALIKSPGPYQSVIDTYKKWTPESTFQTFDNPFGPVNVRHSRKAPYISTTVTQYPGTHVDVSYDAIIEALKKQKIEEKEIATILLDAQATELTDPDAIRAAAMLIEIVYLAEQWRKQGAVKIFRAILRLIQIQKMSLSDIETNFQFVKSAAAGRKQVIRLKQVLEGKIELGSLDEAEQEIFRAMSPQQDGDLESDEEMRTLKESEFKKGRPGMG